MGWWGWWVSLRVRGWCCCGMYLGHGGSTVCVVVAFSCGPFVCCCVVACPGWTTRASSTIGNIHVCTSGGRQSTTVCLGPRRWHVAGWSTWSRSVGFGRVHTHCFIAHKSLVRVHVVDSCRSIVFRTVRLVDGAYVHCGVRGMVKRRQWTIVTAVDEN